MCPFVMNPRCVSILLTNPLLMFLTRSTEMLPAVKIVAKPDYPVAAGQVVLLYCSSAPVSLSVNWTWLHLLQDKSWKVVGFEKQLTLTKPEESGQYQCKAETQMQMKQSQIYTVCIVSFQAAGWQLFGFSWCLKDNLFTFS